MGCWSLKKESGQNAQGSQKFEREEDRLRSLNTKKSGGTLPHSSDTLAKNGFFWNADAKANCTVCSSCGKAVLLWTKEMLPWYAHKSTTELHQTLKKYAVRKAKCRNTKANHHIASPLKRSTRHAAKQKPLRSLFSPSCMRAHQHLQHKKTAACA